LRPGARASGNYDPIIDPPPNPTEVPDTVHRICLAAYCNWAKTNEGAGILAVNEAGNLRNGCMRYFCGVVIGIKVADLIARLIILDLDPIPRNTGHKTDDLGTGKGYETYRTLFVARVVAAVKLGELRNKKHGFSEPILQSSWGTNPREALGTYEAVLKLTHMQNAMPHMKLAMGSANLTERRRIAGDHDANMTAVRRAFPDSVSLIPEDFTLYLNRELRIPLTVRICIIL
jgi:hypothetical protein